MQQFDGQILDSQILDEQIAYYRARASEYDEWFMRQGRYDHGEAHTRQWFAEVEEIRQALALFNPTGGVLEIASGTGWWTEQLVRYADTVVAVDAAMETIEINKQRLHAAQVPAEKVEFIHTNIFDWNQDHAADGQFDAAFFSFWLSHVPPDRFDEFWALVRRSLKPNGRVFVIDSLYNQGSTANDQYLPERENPIMQRRLNDGRTFDIVKVFYRLEQLMERLQALGWTAELKQTDNHFFYGVVRL
ncbi:MAG: class I SAM-dependent methyltransferase [Chloroflexota bacterium]